VPDGVIIPFVQTFIQGSGDDRRFVPNDMMETSADAMLAAISAWIPAARIVSAERGVDAA
jgi:hypothetical protein